MRLTFLGGAGCVTGSRFLVESKGARILVDCGLFQGYKHLRLRNWDPFPVKPSSIRAVLLTHAHIDHSGYLPALARDGFTGPVHCSPATRDLCEVLLLDAARLQEEDAKRANRVGYSRHAPALPLYRVKDARKALKQFHPLPVHTTHQVGPLQVRFIPNGHILGSASILVDDGEERVLFSGDLGRPSDPVIPPPEPMPECDRLVLESTYGARRHPAGDPADTLAELLAETAQSKGVLLVPAFAVGRAQDISWLAHRLMQEGRVPEMPVLMDSPMAARACQVLSRNAALTRLTPRQAKAMESRVHHVSTPQQSLALQRRKGPFLLISSSGMLTGGRVLGHLAARAGDRRSTLLFVGYQAGGTRGARILAGEPEVKVHGRMVPIQCRVASIATLSAHADGPEILAWLSTARRPPKEAYLVHGDPDAADALRGLIQERLGWACRVPLLGETL